MTENEIIEILQTEKACVTRAMNNECNRDCYNCDLCEEGKDILAGYDAVIKAIEENQQYRAIGTIDEFKALKEKSRAKKVFQPFGTHSYKCPSCWMFVAHEVDDNCDLETEMAGWCPYCGQKLDWQ